MEITKEQIQRLGQTDKEMRSTLSEMGFSGLSNKIVLSECAINSDYFWSITRKRWFPDNTQNSDDDATIDFLKEEEEAAQKELTLNEPFDIGNPNDHGPFTLVFSLGTSTSWTGVGYGKTKKEVLNSALDDVDVPTIRHELKVVAVFKGKLRAMYVSGL